MPRDDDFDPVARRRRKRAADQRKVLLIAGAVVIPLGFVLFLGVGLFLVFGKGREAVVSVAGPSASREGENWNHAELLEYLRDRRVVTQRTDGGVNPFGGGSWADFEDGGGRKVTVLLCPTAREAKDKAGAVRPDRVVLWGRFVFLSDAPSLLEAVRAALGA